MKLFGTDGIRGTANVYPMTPEGAVKVGKAAAKVFGGKRIVIGKDTRLSGYMLETALTSGIISMGVDVVLVGPMPTPAVAHLVRSMNCDGGIVLSASHNPAIDNGIKFFDKEGFKLSEEKITEMEKFIFDGVECKVSGDSIGKAYRVDDAKGRYIEFVKSTISGSLKGIRVVLDCANGAAYQIGPAILSELGADVISINDTPDGHNINLNCGVMNVDGLRKKVIDVRADIGIALDGDADRITVIDENSRVLDGDKIIAMCALDLKKRGLLKNNKVVSTIMSNIGFDKCMKENGISVVKTKVGDTYVMEEMRKGDSVLGGEQSGHIIFLEYSTTGDGMTTALQVISQMIREKKKISELAECMKSYPQITLNVAVKEKKEFSEDLKAKIASVERKLGSDGRVLVRYSGTEMLCRVMIEGKDEISISLLAREIGDEISKFAGV